jgi:invasion protein IalB
MIVRCQHFGFGKIRNLVVSAATVAACCVLWQGPAAAQSASPPGQTAPAPVPPSSDASQSPQLLYSPWTKICDKDSKGQEVCLVIEEVRLDTGQFVANAVLVEPQGEARRVLRVTVPLGVQLEPGSRVVIDEGKPVQRPYAICFEIGCISEFVVNTEMMGELKKGQTLAIEAINSTGKPISLPMPLAEFAKANDGPPTDKKVLDERRKKLEDEVRMRQEARKRLGQQPGTSSPAPSAATK